MPFKNQKVLDARKAAKGLCLRGAHIDRPEDTYPVRTLTMGFSIRVDEDATKDTLVQMCERISEMFGEGHLFKPLGNKGLLNWVKWPGQTVGIGSGQKEMRLLVHPHHRVPTIAWPTEVPDDVLVRWRDDDSLCLRRGQYKTQLLSTGDAPLWSMEELEVIRGVFRTAGWRVAGLTSIRGLGRYRPRKTPRKNLKDYRYVTT